MLCLDNSGTRELKALHLVPQYQDQNNHLQSGMKYILRMIPYSMCKSVSEYVSFCT